MEKLRGYVDKKLHYPILVNLRSGVSVTFLSEQFFTKCYKKSFAAKEYMEASIIDSSGVKFIVKEVINLGYTNKFWGLNIFLGQQIYLRIKVEKVKTLSIEEFKKEAVRIVNVNADYYISAGLRVREIKAMIKNANDSGEITKLLLP